MNIGERLSPTSEDVLKVVYEVHGYMQEPVRTTLLQEKIDRVHISTISGMAGVIGTLSTLNLVIWRPYHGIELTDTGRQYALDVIRRHRLIERLLFSSFNVPLEQVHGEADVLEHHVSDYLTDLIDENLDFPATDPHGSPIPRKKHGSNILFMPTTQVN